MQTVASPVSAGSRSRLLRKIWKYRAKYIMLLPAVLLLLLFSYKPMLGIVIAFKNYFPGQDIWQSDWCGLENFEFMQYAEFYEVMLNTLAITGLKLLFGFPAPIIMALMFNEISCQRYKRITQSIAYLPHFMSWIVVAYILESFLSPSVGFVNQLIKSFGGETITFLGRPEHFRSIIVLSSIWKEVGWETIIYLALPPLTPRCMRQHRWRALEKSSRSAISLCPVSCPPFRSCWCSISRICSMLEWIRFCR